MIYQSDEEIYNYSGDGSATESDEELRAQQDAEEFPLGHHGPDSTMLELLGEAEEDGTERTVARDLILQEINKSVRPDTSEEVYSGARKSGRSVRSDTKRKKNRNNKKKKGKKKKGGTSRINKKIVRYDNITGEPTKEYLEKYRHVWKVHKIQRDKQRRGREILENASKLDQYVVESFVYSDHRFELPYEHPIENIGTSDIPEERQKDERVSFHEDLARRWLQAHPDKTLEYLDEQNQRQVYDPETTKWEELPWNKPSEWFLDISKLIEDDRLCIIQMLYEVTIDPYKQLIESLPF